MALKNLENQRHNYVLFVPNCTTQKQQINLLKEIKRLNSEIDILTDKIVYYEEKT